MSVVIDFIEVDRAMEAVLEEFDGTDLNASPAFSGVSPSAERVAERIALELDRRLEADGTLYSVAVTEAPGCCGAYYPGEA